MVGDLRSLLQVSKALTEEVRHREGEPLPEVTQLEHTANPSHPSSGVWLQLGILQPLNVLCVDKLLRLPVGLKAPACGRSSPPPHTHSLFPVNRARIQDFNQFWPETLLWKAAPSGGFVGPAGGSHVRLTHSSAPPGRCLRLPTTKVWSIQPLHTDTHQLPFQPSRFMTLKKKGLHSQETALFLQESRSAAAPYLNLLV